MQGRDAEGILVDGGAKAVPEVPAGECRGVALARDAVP